MGQPLIDISRRHALIFAFFLVFYEFLTYIANDMIMPGMLNVVHEFNSDISYVATSLTAYVLGGASLQLILGPVSDRHGRRPVMIFGAILFFVCTALISMSQSMEQFIVLRFFQGMGLCFITVIGYATIQEIFAENDAVSLIAIMANGSIIAPLLGPLLGAIVIHYLSWRVVFIIIGSFSLIVLWGFIRFMPEVVGQTKKDGSIIPVVPLSLKQIWYNYRELLTNKKFMLGSICIGLIEVPCLSWIGISPIILIKKAHLSVLEYGLWQIPVFGASILANFTIGFLTKRMSLTKVLLVGSTTMAFAMILLVGLPLLFKAKYFSLMPGIIVYFFSLALSLAPIQRITLYSSPVAKGTASALMSLTSMLICVLAVEFASIVYENQNNYAFITYCSGAILVYFMAVFIWYKWQKPEQVLCM